MSLVKFIVHPIIGGVFGIGSALALLPAIAAFTGTNDSGPINAAIVATIFGATIALCTMAPSVRRAFGRGFLLLGACVFALPLSAFLLSGRVASDMLTQAAATDQVTTAIGAGAAGAMITGVAAFFGFFLGSVFIICGLVLSLGGRREVVIVADRRDTYRPNGAQHRSSGGRKEPPTLR